jgi:hypothetical protein
MRIFMKILFSAKAPRRKVKMREKIEPRINLARPEGRNQKEIEFTL